MLAFPVTLAPVALAYLARYAFNTEWAFFGVLILRRAGWRSAVPVLHAVGAESRGRSARADHQRLEQRRRSDRKLMGAN